MVGTPGTVRVAHAAHRALVDRLGLADALELVERLRELGRGEHGRPSSTSRPASARHSGNGASSSARRPPGSWATSSSAPPAASTSTAGWRWSLGNLGGRALGKLGVEVRPGVVALDDRDVAPPRRANVVGGGHTCARRVRDVRLQRRARSVSTPVAVIAPRSLSIRSRRMRARSSVHSGLVMRATLLRRRAWMAFRRLQVHRDLGDVEARPCRTPPPRTSRAGRRRRRPSPAARR